MGIVFFMGWSEYVSQSEDRILVDLWASIPSEMNLAGNPLVH